MFYPYATLFLGADAARGGSQLTVDARVIREATWRVALELPARMEAEQSCALQPRARLAAHALFAAASARCDKARGIGNGAWIRIGYGSKNRGEGGVSGGEVQSVFGNAWIHGIRPRQAPAAHVVQFPLETG